MQSTVAWSKYSKYSESTWLVHKLLKTEHWVDLSPILFNTLTNLCTALYCILLCCFIVYCIVNLLLGGCNSRAPVAQRAAGTEPHRASWEIKGNLWIHFLVVIMASGIAHGCARMTTMMTTTESRKMAAIVQLIWNREIQPWFIASFFDTGHQCYGQLTPVKTEFPLTSIVFTSRAQV